MQEPGIFFSSSSAHPANRSGLCHMQQERGAVGDLGGIRRRAEFRFRTSGVDGMRNMLEDSTSRLPATQVSGVIDGGDHQRRPAEQLGVPGLL